MRGDHVGIIGLLRFAREEKSMIILRIWQLQTIEEVDCHLLELVLFPLRMKRIQEKRVVVAQSQFTGEPFYTDFPKRGIVPTQSRPFSVPRSSSRTNTQRSVSAGDFQSYQTQDEFPVPGAKTILRILRYVPLKTSRMTKR